MTITIIYSKFMVYLVHFFQINEEINQELYVKFSILKLDFQKFLKNNHFKYFIKSFNFALLIFI